jgi:hypothetical protein
MHDVDPVAVSLAKARDFSGGAPPADFCEKCGCQLARACIHWSDWVLRRTEKVRFSGDRCVNRLISIDFLVREDAPVYQAPGGQRFWLVPVSIMRRKTLVNYYLRDEEGHDIPLPGLWLTQYLDESVLRSVAARELERDLNQDAEAFIHDIISGTLEQVEERMGDLREGVAPAEIKFLRDKGKVFIRLLKRMAYSYTLYAFLDADPTRRHRVLRMSLEEPLAFYYESEEPELFLAEATSEEPHKISAWDRVRRRCAWKLYAFAAALGWTTTKVRFRVPAAENAASFHFEIEAPLGVDIVQASIVAAVPEKAGSKSGSLRAWQFDHIRMRLPTVGLHVAAVPNGSFSTAQVDLQVATRGWYATMLLSCWATFLLLIALVVHERANRAATISTADAVVFLAGVAAAVATLIAQGEFSGIAGRLLGVPRMMAAVEASLLLIAASLFLFVGPVENRRRPWELLSLAVIAGVITLTVTTSWILTRLRLGRKYRIASPREMAPGIKGSARNPENFWDAVQLYGYRRPAIRVDSAEAWHYHFNWTPEIEADAAALLTCGARSQLIQEPSPGLARRL